LFDIYAVICTVPEAFWCSFTVHKVFSIHSLLSVRSPFVYCSQFALSFWTSMRKDLFHEKMKKEHIFKSGRKINRYIKILILKYKSAASRTTKTAERSPNCYETRQLLNFLRYIYVLTPDKWTPSWKKFL
jgi:hypothetical protein